MSSAATAAGLAAGLVYTNPHRRPQLPPSRTRSRSTGSQKRRKGKVRRGTDVTDDSSTPIASLNQGQASKSTLCTQPATNTLSSTEAVDSIHCQNFIAPSTDTKFRRDAPTRSGDTIPSSHHLLVAKTLSATNEAMSRTLNTRRRSPSLPSLYTYGSQALNFNAPFATSGPSPTLSFASSDRTNMNFFVGDEGSRIAESRTRRPQKERLRSNVHDPRLQRSASFYFPEPSPLPRRRIVRPSTSPGIAAAASPKPKTPFITIKWLTKRRDRKDSLKQGEETGNLPHHHHSESHGVTTFKFAPPPVTPPSSDFEDFESRLRSSRRASIIQDTSEMNTHTRVSLIIDHVDVSDSDLEEEDPLSPTTPPPPRITRKDKLQKLLPNEPSHQPHLHRKFPSKLNNSPTSATRPRLNLNLNFARPRPNPYHSTSHSPVTPTYDEQDGWCIDDRYLSTQVADGEEDDDDDDGGGITPVSDIVFGDRPPTPKPPKQQVDRPEKEHEEWKSPMSPSDSIPTPPTSPPPSSSTVTKQVIQGPRRSPSPTGCHSAPFSDLPELPSTTRSEKTVKGDERDDSKTTPRSRGRRLSTGSSYGVIFSRATSPTPGLWSVVDSREVASEVELGPWVGYWNRGSLKEVLAELRELRLNI